MTKEEILALMKEKGKADALDLRSRAKDLDGTAIIAEESKIPQFDPTKDYSIFPVGSPVYETVDGERQIFTLIQPHNASYYPGSTPSNTRALWSLKHTKDIAKAKPWVAPLGTSGMYDSDDVCTSSGHIWRSKKDSNPYEPGSAGTDDYWEDLGIKGNADLQKGIV